MIKTIFSYLIALTLSSVSFAQSSQSVFHCTEGEKQERHFNVLSLGATQIIQIQETYDGGSGTSDDGKEILIRQLGVDLQLGSQYLLTIELTSPGSKPCSFPAKSNPFILACNPFQTESNISNFSLKDITTGQAVLTNEFSVFSITSLLRTELRSDSDSETKQLRFQINIFGAKNRWPKGASEEFVFPAVTSLAGGCQLK